MTTPEPTVLAQEVEKLKNEGNDLYKKSDHAGARQKYSEAIEKDPKNPILYANRAAAYIAERHYADAGWDCQRAVDLDPAYTKAWARLATCAHALESWDYCIFSWKKALDLLPKEGRTEAEELMKTQFTAGFEKAQEAQKVSASIQSHASGPNVIDQATAARGLPWVRARRVARQSEPRSSAHVILSAYDEFKEGLDAMATLKIHEGPQGPMFFGNTNAIICLSNAILSDERSFHMKDPKFPENLNIQCKFENQVHRGWALEGGADHLKKEALKRLQAESWATVRPAIAITVRIWIFNAYFRAELAGHREAAHELFSQALDVLEWGRKEWPDVPKELRGAVFERSFIRGVKRLRISNMHKEIVGGGVNSKLDGNELGHLAQELLEDVNSDPIPESMVKNEPAHCLAFWDYCNGSAASILGWHQMATVAHLPHDDPEYIKFNLNAASFYKGAAEFYPVDDESHAYFLRMSLDCLCNARAPLKDTLPLCKRIRHAIPRAKEIWQVSEVARVLTQFSKDIAQFEMEQMRDLSTGKATMETVAVLPKVRPRIHAQGP